MAEFDLRAIARFLPEFERADFSPTHISAPKMLGPRLFEVPSVVLSPAVLEFVNTAYEAGWVLKGFNWQEWKETGEGGRLCSDPRLIADATPHQLARLLTVSIRQDRFSEGSLTTDFDRGHILAIVRRAAQLAAADSKHAMTRR